MKKIIIVAMLIISTMIAKDIVVAVNNATTAIKKENRIALVSTSRVKF